MNNYALIKNGKVINTAIWDGVDIDFGEGVNALVIPEGSQVSAGYVYLKGNFFPPKPSPEELEEQQKNKLQYNLNSKNSFIDMATQKIAVWQTKLLIGRRLTPEEEIKLNAWLDYIDSLESIEANTSENINWPREPE